MPAPEEAAFLKAVFALPDDDGPRLVYADWLDEQGDPKGEFIRTQVELARLPGDDPRRPELAARAQALLAAHRPDWDRPLVRLLDDSPLQPPADARQRPVRGWDYRRGFVEVIDVQAWAFASHANVLFMLMPLSRVRMHNAHELIGRLVTSPALARLRELDLSDNGITDFDAALLARCIHLSRLRSLDLRRNPIGPDGVRDLRRSPFLSRVTELQLDGEPTLAAERPPRMSALPPRTVTPLLPPPGFAARWADRLRRLFE
jgi:uncharacterized protein (TIGR02996 family)